MAQAMSSTMMATAPSRSEMDDSESFFAGPRAAINEPSHTLLFAGDAYPFSSTARRPAVALAANTASLLPVGIRPTTRR